jgi:aminoglycoside N3'-acetyltransferase
MLTGKIIKSLQKFFKKNKSKVNFVHVDLLKSFKIKFDNKKNFTNNHYKMMKLCTNNSNLWFPSFNYQFAKNKIFNLTKDKSETGSFTEMYRVYFSKWRTETPIFNIIGDGKKPLINVKNKSIINPFDKTSFFHLLYKMKSNIFFYGTEINSGSFIMYVEETLKNQILYRYKKKIKGKIISNKIKKNIFLYFNVRPLEKKFPVEYDWKKIEKKLKKENLFLKFSSGNRNFGVLNLKKTTDFLQKIIKKDPLFLLNTKSKKWVKNFYLTNKRGINLNDFEK